MHYIWLKKMVEIELNFKINYILFGLILFFQTTYANIAHEKIEFNKSQKEYLKVKKSIKMCIDPNWMPFEKIVNGKHIGLTSDYMKIIEKHIGIPIKLIITKSWSESESRAKHRECDILSMVPIIEDRKKYMNFTSPYLNIPMVIATKNHTPYIDSIEALLDVKIGIVKGYSIANILKSKYPTINIVNVESIDDGLKKVESGEIFAFVDNLATIDYKIQKEYLSSLKVSGRVDMSLKYRIGSRNDEPILNEILEKIILSIEANTKEEIFAKWVQRHEKETIIDYTMLYYAIFIFLIIISIVSYFYIKQNKLKQEILKLNCTLEDRIKHEVNITLKQKELLEQQTKMAQMGEMIGAIAHQWRQPLNTIMTSIQNLQFDYEDGYLKDEKFVKEFIEKNKKTIKFMSHTIDDFRNFFRVDKEKNNFYLKESIESVVAMLSSQIEQNHIELKIYGNEVSYYGLQSEYQQVIMNIINNAKDIFMEKKIEKPTINIFVKDNSVTIEDNAGGIPKNILDRVFEPYFTTKEQGKGTGMGLYMSKMIIEKNMNGILSVKNIDFKSKDGQLCHGAKFTIELNS